MAIPEAETTQATSTIVAMPNYSPSKTSATHKKTPSQVEDFLRCAKQANIKTTEDDWEVLRKAKKGKTDKEGRKDEDDDWVFVK